MRTLALIGLGASCLLAGNEPKQRIQVSNTQRADLMPGGALRIENSTGELMVLGWDRPDIEITTVKFSKAYDPKEREKATKELDEVRISVEPRDRDLVIKTDFPRHSAFSPPFRGGTRFDLEYYIKAPRDARVIVAHDVGGVHVEDMTGDISVTARQGEITLRIPGEGQYTIDARSKLGDVISDFPGRGKQKPWLLGHQFASDTAAGAHKLFLRIGYGDIIIWKTLRLPPPAPY
jgi:hypothetical protein